LRTYLLGLTSIWHLKIARNRYFRAKSQTIRSLFAVHPELLLPVLQIIHRAIATFLFKQTGQTRDQATTGAVTLIQRFGSAANPNVHLHALVLDGVYGNPDAAGTSGTPDESMPAPAAAPIFHAAAAPTHAAL